MFTTTTTITGTGTLSIASLKKPITLEAEIGCLLETIKAKL